MNRKLIINMQQLSDGTPCPLSPREMAEHLIGIALAYEVPFKWESNKTFVLMLDKRIGTHRELEPRLLKPVLMRERQENWRGRKITVRDEIKLGLRIVRY